MIRGRAKARTTSKRKRPVVAAAEAAERSLKIGDAARSVGVEPYVLRFWETQFPFIRPKHSRSRHRSYNQADLETLKVIKRLLHTEGYTIAGARKYIREKGIDSLRSAKTRLETQIPEHPSSSSESGVRVPLNGETHRALCEIREDLRSIHRMLGQSGLSGRS